MKNLHKLRMIATWLNKIKLIRVFKDQHSSGTTYYRSIMKKKKKKKMHQILYISTWKISGKTRIFDIPKRIVHALEQKLVDNVTYSMNPTYE